MTSNTEEKKRVLPPVTLDESYRLCQQRVHEDLGSHRWILGNLAREQRPHVYAVLALSVRSARLCDIHLGCNARLELLDDLREDFRNNFMEEESTDQFPALLDTRNRFEIPEQYLHDIVATADMCVRIDRFSSFDQWLQLGCRMGGGTLLSLIPVIGAEHKDYEAAAMSCGQAIWLTHLLRDICDEIQKLEYFLPTEDLDEFGVDLSKHNPLRPDKALLRLIRLNVERIEKLFEEGGQLVRYLSRDGQRILKSLISMYWTLLMKIKLHPEQVLQS
ncbi:MAG: phytoene/squalene synthase family protein, partial [Pirellulaceae bacterium]